MTKTGIFDVLLILKTVSISLQERGQPSSLRSPFGKSMKNLMKFLEF